jgi:Holliday junction resolvase RusA-like endonuclease
MVEFELPAPPPLNSVYRSAYCHGKLVTYKSKEAKEYALEVALRLNWMKPSSSPCQMGIIFYYHRDRDIDSGLKVLLDAMEHRVYENDKQIVSLSVRKVIIPKGEPQRVSVEVGFPAGVESNG